ncbi:hypothetical protein [Nocardia sp. CA-120079]|uniref:hypothetical protein n=1 Tax=Nocardia sp. CA-120079 TaxID=3239974 RepID=UPI003D957762
MLSPEIPALALPGPWHSKVRSHSGTTVLLEVGRPSDGGTTVELERCNSGRLRHSYPVDSHDIEARILGALPTSVLAELLTALSSAIAMADPRCRRLVYAAPAEDTETIATAEAAGFRYVVDVDLPDSALSLLVSEPRWVTAVDADLDRVPGT